MMNMKLAMILFLLSAGALVSSTTAMNHRALVDFGGSWLTVGGRLADQRVTDRVVACERV